jgi:hypothetical protein
MWLILNEMNFSKRGDLRFIPSSEQRRKGLAMLHWRVQIGVLRQLHIEQDHPILEGLQREAAED